MSTVEIRRGTVLLVDDHDLLRLGLRMLLHSHRAAAVVGEATTVEEATRQAVGLRPALVVTERTLPDGSGIELCRSLRERLPGTKVAILTESLDGATAAAAAAAGAAGYLWKRMAVTELCATLRSLAAGDGAPGTDGGRVNGGDLSALTGQERRVLELVAHGKTNREIGAMLGLSEKTVKNYLYHAFEKLGVSRRAQAAVFFIGQFGLSATAPIATAPRARSA